MRQALIIGGGSENGMPIMQTLLDNDFRIINFGSSVYDHPAVTNYQQSWNDIDIEFVQRQFSKFYTRFDFVFFNHNGSSLCQQDFDINHDDILKQWGLVRDWSHSHWISCQMPFLILHTIRHNLHCDSRVGWMLSSYVDYRIEATVDFPDYSANKYFNHAAMRAFGKTKRFQTFGIIPDFSKSASKADLRKIIDDIVNNRCENMDLFRC